MRATPAVAACVAPMLLLTHAMLRAHPSRLPALATLALVGLAGASSACSSAHSPLESATTQAQTTSAWHVGDGFIRDAQGRAVILRGVNVANSHKHAPYFGWQKAADFDRLRADWGFDAVRLLVTWAAIEPEKGRIDDAYLDAVAERVKWAQDAGLLVFADMHQDIYGEGFAPIGDGAPRWTCPEAMYDLFQPAPIWFLNYADTHVAACFGALWTSDDLQSHYAEAVRRLSARLAEFPAFLGVDLMNEPPLAIASFYERMAKAMRAGAPGALAFVEPANTRNVPDPVAPEYFSGLSIDGVVYAPHSYDPQAEAGWGYNTWSGDILKRNIANLASEARAGGAPLVIGEYGAVARTCGANTRAYMDATLDGADAQAASALYWSYDADDDYGLLDAKGNEKPDVLDAIVRAYPARVAGTPISWSTRGDPPVFTFEYVPSGGAVTEIVVPERLYPDGYRVDCDGCTTEKAPGVVRVTSPPKGSPATIVVHP